MNTCRTLSIPVMALGLSFATPSFAQTFTYTQIDVPNSSQTRPFGINTFGQIVGLSRDSDGTPHGFLRYADGTYFKFEYPGATFTNAMGINDQGMIVGSWIDRFVTEGPRWRRPRPVILAALNVLAPPPHIRAQQLRLRAASMSLGPDTTKPTSALA
jgi:probable HAF family extracellular repeat protein